MNSGFCSPNKRYTVVSGAATTTFLEEKDPKPFNKIPFCVNLAWGEIGPPFWPTHWKIYITHW